MSQKPDSTTEKSPQRSRHPNKLSVEADWKLSTSFAREVRRRHLALCGGPVPRKKVTLRMNSEYASALRLFAKANGVSSGEIIEAVVGRLLSRLRDGDFESILGPVGSKAGPS